MLLRPIPSTNELLPVIGLGTWQTFDVPAQTAHPELQQVIKAMHNAGGTLIDSSPMYGRAEEVIGRVTQAADLADKFFYATKVWIQGKKEGIRQMDDSFRKMQRPVIELMQIHNLVDWKHICKQLINGKTKAALNTPASHIILIPCMLNWKK